MEIARAQRITRRFFNRLRDTSPLPLPRLRFETLSPMIRDAVFIVDGRGIITHWNRAAEMTFGYQSSEIVGQPFYKLILPARDVAEIKVFLSEGEGPWKHKEFETVLFHRDEHAIKVKLKFSAVEEHNKWFTIGVVEPADDFEIEREEMVRRAETQSRLAALGRMGGGTVHEMNNKLTVVSTYVAMIPENLLRMYNCLLYELDLLGALEARTQIEEDLQAIAAAAKELASMARNFMNFGGRGVENLVLFSPNEKIENVIKLIEPSFRRKGVELSEKIVPDLPALLGLPGVFEQCIYNLLINAWHATPGKGRVVITAYSQESAVVIRILDTGAGIPPENRERIFDPFFSTKSRESGTGLGLSLVKRAIEEMGGKISFRTQVGKGTIFTIEIPYAERD